ncbi:MAG TPA: B12-binding domain-containing protein, partial [Candidatus Bathyarchaeia archaeon]|nr:B12-binding domain-containing protein [Candidatus Bathyarchaeia archaeon]
MSDIVSRYLQALLDRDSVSARSIVMSAVESSQDLLNVFDILGNAQVEIGSLWEKNVISVADEHYATQ